MHEKTPGQACLSKGSVASRTMPATRSALWPFHSGTTDFRPGAALAIAAPSLAFGRCQGLLSIVLVSTVGGRVAWGPGA
jgi:hypothetical protein